MNESAWMLWLRYAELLRDRPHPDCIFAKFHAWSVDEEDQLGLVLELRSLVPKRAQELDL
jgi:hypothetical protein